ncbi:MAG: hypothetical protein V1873_02840 [Verrucomicrobiota bacterium]
MPSEVCKNHPETPAAWRCTSCGGLFCDPCIVTQSVGTVHLHICRSCRGKCAPVGAAAAAEEAAVAEEAPPSPADFFAQVPRAFAYPFKGAGAILLITGALFFWFLKFASFSMFAIFTALFASGYLSAYMLRIINATADGNEELPDWPSFTDLWQDVVQPYFLILGVNLFCFSPAILYFIVSMYYKVMNPWIFLVLLGLGVFYLPMGLLGAAIFDSTAGLNPRRIVPSIFKTFGAYLVACAVMAVVAVLRIVAVKLLPLIPVPVVGSVIEGILSFYFLAVEMRILGLLYRTHEKKLGWFDDFP